VLLDGFIQYKIGNGLFLYTSIRNRTFVPNCVVLSLKSKAVQNFKFYWLLFWE